MSDASVKRPPILTGACLYLGLLATVISIRAITVVTSWNAENRADDVSFALRALRDAGLGAEGAETFYRTFVTVLAVLAAAGAVFAVFTARGDRASRVGMTVTIGVVGVATFAGALGTTFFMAMVGALAVVFTIRLWTGEIRTYFRTLAGHPPPPPTPAPAPQPPAYQYPPGFGPPPGREPMPKPVAFVVWSTLVSSAVVVAGAGLMVLMLAVLGSADYEELVSDSSLSRSMVDQAGADYQQLYRTSITLLSLCAALGLGGVAAGVNALVRRRRGGVFLFVMAVVTLIPAVVMFPLGLPWVGLCIAVLVQLRKPESKAWFAKP